VVILEWQDTKRVLNCHVFYMNVVSGSVFGVSRDELKS